MLKRYCCVPGCSNTSDSVDLNGNNIFLHRFPMSDKKKHIKKLWIQRLRHVRANLVVVLTLKGPSQRSQYQLFSE